MQGQESLYSQPRNRTSSAVHRLMLASPAFTSARRTSYDSVALDEHCGQEQEQRRSVACAVGAPAGCRSAGGVGGASPSSLDTDVDGIRHEMRVRNAGRCEGVVRMGVAMSLVEDEGVKRGGRMEMD